MKIIIDTREQLPLSFTGHETISRKLDEGDYNCIELEDKIVIERKSIPDFYGSITNGHERFKKEIKRSIEKNKPFFIFIEGDISQIFKFVEKREGRVRAIGKTITTMCARYGIKIIECKDRDEMSKKIVELMEKWIQQEQQKENM